MTWQGRQRTEGGNTTSTLPACWVTLSYRLPTSMAGTSNTSSGLTASEWSTGRGCSTPTAPCRSGTWISFRRASATYGRRRHTRLSSTGLALPHLSHHEKTELLEALRQRYSSREINLSALTIELQKLRLNASEIQDELRLLAEVTTYEPARNNRERDSGRGVFRGSSPSGRPFACPADQAQHDKSVEWLSAYRAAKAHAKRSGVDDTADND